MSRKYTCIVVEDEPLARNILKKYIGEHPSLESIGYCSDALEAEPLLNTRSVDILFLDINLPRLSGIHFLKTLVRPPLVIFTTAYPEFAVEGFELDAVDYLLKPFSFERFLKAVNKAIEKMETRDSPSPEPSSIFLKSDKKIFQVELDDILYLEALDDYVKVHTRKTTLLIHNSLKRMLEELPSAQFMRTHKSFVVAKNKIVFLEGNYLKIGDRDIPIGASYRDEILNRLKDNTI